MSREEITKKLEKRERITKIILAVMLAFTLDFLIFEGFIKKPMKIESKELEPYVQYFKEAAALYKADPDYSNLTVSFVDRYPVNNWLALCQVVGKNKFVSFLKSHFEKASAEERYAIVIHELGHCTLDLPHVEGYRPDGCPRSIMHPSDNMFGCFFRNQEYYFSELFNRN